MRVAGLLLSLLLVFNTSAASWYVDNAASGANNGTSWENAWESCADVVWAGAGVVAGDTLYLSGGATSKTYTDIWSVGASGTEGNPITIRVGQDAGHNGLVLFDYAALGDEATAEGLTCSRNNITIDGSVDGVSKWLIANLVNTNDRVACYGIWGGTTTNVSISYITATNVNNPIKIQSSIGTEVSHCDLTFRGDVGIGLVQSKGEFGASSVHNNSLTVMYNAAVGGPDAVQSGSGVDIYSNSFGIVEVAVTTSTQHPDYIQAQGSNWKAFNNTFTDIGDAAIDFDGFAHPTPSNIWIYNNLFRIVNTVDAFPNFIRFYRSGGPLTSFTGIKVLNNVFANNTTFFPVTFNLAESGNPSATDCEIKNNIFYNCGNGTTAPMIFIGASTNATAADWGVETNVFYRATGTQYVTVDGAQSTTTDWVSANGGSTSLPDFVNAATGDYRLTADDTVARGQGVNLSAYFTTDKNGVARGSTWDIGAFEFQPSRIWNIGTVNAVNVNVGGSQ